MKHFKSFLLASLCGVLAGCSSFSETFDCPAGTGVGCARISEVNKMVNKGSFGGEDETKALSPVVATANPFTKSPDPAIQRIQEEHLRVWIAPFQDEGGSLHEGSIVHVVLKPGYWRIKEGA